MKLDPRPAGGGSSPGVPPATRRANRDEAVGKAWGRTRTRQETLALYADSCDELVKRGAWANGEEIDDKSWGVLSRWADKMRACGTEGWIEVCPQGHRARAVTACCQVAPCPRHQRRRSDVNTARMDKLARDPRYQDENTATGHRWKLLTITLRDTLPHVSVIPGPLKQGGGPERDVERMIRVRANLLRWLHAHYGREDGKGGVKPDRFAAVAGIEVGEEAASSMHVHLHVLLYSCKIERPALLSWLRSQDCTTERCPHPADDRCEVCRRKREKGERFVGCGRECWREHPAYKSTGGARCSGSYMAHVSALERDVLGRPRVKEAAKYAMKPILGTITTRDDAGEKTGEREPTAEEHELYREKVLRFLLAMRGRHRVESYGAARERQPDEELAQEDAEGHGLCGHEGCQASMETVRAWRWEPVTGRLRTIPLRECRPFAHRV